MTKAELLDEVEKQLIAIPPSRVAGIGVAEDCQRWAIGELYDVVVEMLLRHATGHPIDWDQVHASMQKSLLEGIQALRPTEFQPSARRAYLKRLQRLLARL